MNVHAIPAKTNRNSDQIFAVAVKTQHLDLSGKKTNNPIAKAASIAT
jgi:hypothetical protein